MSQRMSSIIHAGRVAVVTGAAKGLGAALAQALAARGMKLAVIDLDGSALERLAASLDVEVLAMQGDVTRMDALVRFKAAIDRRYGPVHLLVNNVGMMRHAGPWDAPAQWRATLDANFTSVLASQHLFVPDMIASELPAAVVNLGSKEGITTPPGNAAYSVAKAGVKVLTEQLAHELLQTTGGRVSAHLLVPGYTWTPMNFPDTDFNHDIKPEAPWSAAQVVDYFMRHLLRDDFYMICPDNEVSPALDAMRIRWAMDDMLMNRPALSRWHPQWRERYAAWIAGQSPVV